MAGALVATPACEFVKLAAISGQNRFNYPVIRLPGTFFPLPYPFVSARIGGGTIPGKPTEIIDAMRTPDLELRSFLLCLFFLAALVMIQELKFLEDVPASSAIRYIQIHRVPPVKIDPTDIPALAKMKQQHLAVLMIFIDVASDKPLIPVTADITNLAAGILTV